ncbi:MAG: hypothetical protein AB7P20_22585 [Rhizobiaceae bacterium]
MNRFLIYLGRFALIVAGYALAALVASIALHVLTLPRVGLQQEMSGPVVASIMFWSIPFMALIIAYMAFVPSMIAIGLGEALSARGWLYYALAGGLIGFMLAMLFQGSAPDDFLAAGSELEVLPPDQSIYDPVFLAVLAGSGMFGGLAYWLVTGRTSGGWALRRPTSPAP